MKKNNKQKQLIKKSLQLLMKKYNITIKAFIKLEGAELVSIRLLSFISVNTILRIA